MFYESFFRMSDVLSVPISDLEQGYLGYLLKRKNGNQIWGKWTPKKVERTES